MYDDKTDPSINNIDNMAQHREVPEKYEVGFERDYSKAEDNYDGDDDDDDECIDTSSNACQDGLSGLDNLDAFPLSSDDGYDGDYSDAKDFASHSHDDTSGILFAPSDGFSYSKTWVSEEEAARMRYQKCVANFHHMGCYVSPVIPSTFEEWIELKADYAERKLAWAQRHLSIRLKDLKQKRCILSTGSISHSTAETPVVLSKKLTAYAQADGKSIILGLNITENPQHTNKPLIEWPSYKEFKTEGDERVKGRRRYDRKLPLPKLRELAAMNHRQLGSEPKVMPIEGSSIPDDTHEINKRTFSVVTDIMPPCDEDGNDQVTSVTCASSGNTIHISLDDPDHIKDNGFLYEFLEEIDSLE